MSICREFCEMVEELIEDLDGVFEGTCLAKRDDNDRGHPITAPEPGDIIGVDRGIYQHYGIYAGDNSVIHYTAETSDLDAENAEIQETSLERFLRGEEEFFVLKSDDDEIEEEVESEEDDGEGEEVHSDEAEEDTAQEPPMEEEVRCYNPETTVVRARSRIGERKYNLLTNNCEHFAVWCKTGISESAQVRKWVTYCTKIILGD